MSLISQNANDHKAQKHMEMRGKSWARLLAMGLAWISLGVIVFWVLHLQHPYLFFMRAYELPCLLGLSAGAGVLGWWRLQGISKWLFLGLLAGVVFFAIGKEFQIERHKEAVMQGAPADMALLGEHFIVGYRDVETLKPLITRGLIGGVFITHRNVVGKDVQALRQEIAQMQQWRAQAGLPPLVIAVDQEGGSVSRLSPPLPFEPPLSTLLNKNVSEATVQAQALAYGHRQGLALASLGVTVNFSPVVDLKPETEHATLDFHSRIDLRAISSDPVQTARIAAAYAQGLRDMGVRATLKHFPGLGRLSVDTHHFSAVLDVPVDTLQKHDWLPFRLVSEQGDGLIMLAHVILSQVDAENPASFSKAVVQQVIREGWGYEGILVTDDLTMQAAYQHGICNAVVKSLNAGVDLLLIAYDYEKFNEAMYCVMQAREEGRLDMEKLARSQQRLQTLSATSNEK